MRRWPPIVWPAMSFASLLILLGLGPWDPVALAIGVTLAVVVFVVSLIVAEKRMRDRPPPMGLRWLMAAHGRLTPLGDTPEHADDPRPGRR